MNPILEGSEHMKNYKTIWVSLLLVIACYAGPNVTVYASPVFPPADNEPINQISKKPTPSTEPTSQNTSTENANLHKDNSYGLAQIEVKILFGKNENGGKSYKTTYQLAEIKGNKNTDAKQPQIHVTFKNKTDQDKYAVEEVFVKKMANNAYKITAKIIDSKPGEIVTPKVTWLD